MSSLGVLRKLIISEKCGKASSNKYNINLQHLEIYRVLPFASLSLPSPHQHIYAGWKETISRAKAIH